MAEFKLNELTTSACGGNACGVISRADAGGCIIFTNHGTRSVHVQLGPYGMTLAPGASGKVVSFGGQCPGIVVGDLTANYV
jgi:hypothetical protein